MAHSLPIALQFYTIRDPLAANLAGTCRAVAKLGYTHAEIGPFGHSTEEIAAKCREAGLFPFSTHEMSLADAATASEAIELARKLGLAYAVQPYLAEEQRTAEEYARILQRLTGLDGRGDITVCYHNHDFEFHQLPDGRIGWNVLFEDTALKAELDVCWVAVAGHNPVVEMQRLKGRLPLLHIKDCSDFQNKTLCEVGTGMVDLPAVLAAAPDCGVKYLVVEQDNNWIDNDPIKSVDLSLRNLKKMLA